MTTTPLGEPVATPMLKSVVDPTSRLKAAKSFVASLTPCSVAGFLPDRSTPRLAGARGTILRPRVIKAFAAAFMSGAGTGAGADLLNGAATLARAFFILRFIGFPTRGARGNRICRRADWRLCVNHIRPKMSGDNLGARLPACYPRLGLQDCLESLYCCTNGRFADFRRNSLNKWFEERLSRHPLVGTFICSRKSRYISCICIPIYGHVINEINKRNYMPVSL